MPLVPLTSREHHAHRILTELEGGRQVSQRSLARSLGIALGLTNLLLGRLVRKGWIRVIKIKPNRIRYLLTPTGIAEKARMSRAYFQNSLRFYAETRDRIRERFAALSEECSHTGDGVAASKRIVFLGTGEVAEIGYICLQETDLELVGVVDDHDRGRFFDVPIYPRSALSGNGSSHERFDRLVVMSFGDTDRIHAQLDELGLPPDRVFWV